MSKSTLRRLVVQIPESEQPAFLAATFSLSVLKDAVAIAGGGAETWRKDDDLISDDYQSISAWCPNGCGKTMQVVRPGKFQCAGCG